MHNRTKGALAGVAGLALLAGGTTFALWSDSAAMGGGDLASGHLEIRAIGDPQYWDVSPDRHDATGTSPVTGTPGHEIDLAAWRMVPGDVIEATLGYAMALEGDNLRATLSVGPGAATGDLVAGDSPEWDSTEGVSFTYGVYGAGGELLTDKDGKLLEDISLGTSTELRFQPADTGQANGEGDPRATVIERTNFAEGDEDVDVRVVVTATFDEDTPERVRTRTQAALGEIGAIFAQVRDAGSEDE